tara:strand:+ start:148 stop:372 length:225 start_codon:yes stop_codon:yes gene_type:complete
MKRKRKEAKLLGYSILFNKKGQLITERTTTDIKELESKLTKEDFNLLQAVLRSGTRELNKVHNLIEEELNARKG